MLTLKSKQDSFRLLLPEEFIPEEINDKYARILQKKHGFIYKPIDFLNESIQKIQVLGFQTGTVMQQQTARGYQMMDFDKKDRSAQNRFLHTSIENAYRSATNPLQLLDKTLNVTFRHTLGFLNYFLMFESFWYQYCRDETYDKMPKLFSIDITNEIGEIYSKVILDKPIIDSMDMLDLDYSQPVAQSQTFKVTWKYSDIDFQFIDTNEDDGDI